MEEIELITLLEITLEELLEEGVFEELDSIVELEDLELEVVKLILELLLLLELLELIVELLIEL